MLRVVAWAVSAVFGLVDAVIAEIDRSFATTREADKKADRGCALAIGPKEPRKTAPPPDARFLIRKALDHLDALELYAAEKTASAAMAALGDERSPLSEDEERVILDGCNDISHWIFSLTHEDPLHRELPANRECREDIRALRRRYPPLTDPALLARIRATNQAKTG